MIPQEKCQNAFDGAKVSSARDETVLSPEKVFYLCASVQQYAVVRSMFSL